MIPCYVSGKGMHATALTRDFKTLVIRELESSGSGYDTRYRYYRAQYPGMAPDELARMVCDPIECYDKDWPDWLAAHPGAPETALATFVLERDTHFREEARVACYCFDEAGFGSGINVMRFIRADKPLLGFYRTEAAKLGMNLANVLQLGLEFPGLVTLVCYGALDEVPPRLAAFLRGVRA